MQYVNISIHECIHVFTSIVHVQYTCAAIRLRIMLAKPKQNAIIMFYINNIFSINSVARCDNSVGRYMR